MTSALAVNPDPTTDALAFRAARDLCRRRSPGLFYAFQLLPAPKRDAACAVVAFCGMIRDAIGGAGADSTRGARGLREHPAVVSPAGACCSHSAESCDALRTSFVERLSAIYAGRVELPAPQARSPQQHALHAFEQAVRRCEIPREVFLDVADAAHQDGTVVRYATWRSLNKYLERAGGAVSLAVAYVMGMTHPDARRAAVQLGAAARLVEVLRSVGRDRAAGRVYLPLEDLARCRYTERDLLSGVVNDALRKVVRREAERGRALCDEAASALGYVASDRGRLAAAVVVVMCRDALEQVERRPERVFASDPPPFSPLHALRRFPAAWKQTHAASLSPSRRGTG